MVSAKEVVFATSPPTAVTVIVWLPSGADELVETVRVVEHVGLHEAEENEAVVLVGRPDTEKETELVVPAESDAVMTLATDSPAVTDLEPSSKRAKSNGIAFIARVKVVVLVTPPPIPVIVIT